MRVFAVSGFAKTGKTTTIAAMIGELVRRGYQVGTVKDSRCPGLTLEQAGTDTAIHRAAGAAQVALRTLSETNLMFPERLPLQEILSHYQQDIIILEGFSQYEIPKIVTGILPFDVKAKQTASTFAVSGVISNELQMCQGLPVINALTQVETLCDLVLAKVEDRLPACYKELLTAVG